MKIPVVILGYNRVGKRLAVALQRQPDLRVAMVCDPDKRRLAEARQKGWLAREAPDSEASQAGSWWVDCRRWSGPEEEIVVSPAGVKDGSPMAGFSLLNPSVKTQLGGIRVCPANTLAYARLFRALSRIGSLHRCQATVVEPPSPQQQESLDALQPIFDRIGETEVMKQALASVVSDFHLCRVAAPYSRSRLHMVRLEFNAKVGGLDVRQALEAAPRIVLGAARDGFTGTAQVQEFCRDAEGRNGNRPELFIWSESVVVSGNRVHLVMDVEPDQTPIPETIDAIRLSMHPNLTLDESIALTDRALGLKLDFNWVATRRIETMSDELQPVQPSGVAGAIQP